MKHRICVGIVGVCLALAPACGALEPETGAFQGAREAGAPSSSGQYGGKTSKPEGGGPDPRCLPDGGFADDDCDLCENANCCEERFDCLDDDGCAKASDDFEACPHDAGPRAPSCWNDLANSSALGSARVACLREHCQSPCLVP
jgi:hypothetical protein